MNIDFKKPSLEFQQWLVHLVGIEAQLNDLPGHLRALMPHLDAINQAGAKILAPRRSVVSAIDAVCVAQEGK